MTKQNKIIAELIKESDLYSFNNNKKYSTDQYYSYATPDFLAWVSKVENFIRTNYDENSGPHRMLDSVNQKKFSGYYQSEFETEFTKLKGAIKSCENLKANKKINENNYILSLIKNPFFWTVIVVLIGASYKLGFDNGNSRFDNEKNELNKQNLELKDSIQKLNNVIKKQVSLASASVTLVNTK